MRLTEHITPSAGCFDVNDGDLAAKLTHPKFHKKKIYAVTLDKELDEVDEAIIRAGVILDDERIIPDAMEFPKADEST